MKLFKTYSAKDIHALIIAKNIAMINDMIELQKKSRMSAPVLVSKEYNRLNSLGLGNTKNAQILKAKIEEVEQINNGIDLYNAEVDKQKELCQFLKEMLEVFGHDTLLVRYDDFEQIIRKYNLACGRLEDYTGSIPEKNLIELENAKQKLKIAKDYTIKTIQREYSRKSFYESGLIMPYWLGYGRDDGNDDSKEYLHPSLNKHIHDLLKIKEIDPDYVDKSKIESYKIFPFIKAKDYYSTELLDSFREVRIDDKGDTNLFIVAPYKDIKNGVRLRRFVRAEDPFICSYTTFGIMIHTKWGDEAEDEILDKYHKMINLLEE